MEFSKGVINAQPLTSPPSESIFIPHPIIEGGSMFRTIYVIALLCTWSFAQQPTPETAQQPANDLIVSFMNGTVEVKKAGSEQWEAIKINMKLSEKDIVRTAVGSEAELKTSDGGITFKLKEETTLELDALLGKKSVTQKNGSVFFIIKSVLLGADAFTINTPTATAAIRGTAFAVGCKEGSAASFAVVQGKIAVKGTLGEEIFVKAGEISKVLANAAPTPPAALSPDALKRLEEWGATQFQAYSEPIAQAAEPEAPATDAAAPGEGEGGASASMAAAGSPLEQPIEAAPEAGAADQTAAGKGDEAAQGKEEEKKEEPKPAGKKGGISWGLSVGSVTMGDQQWTRISLRPDIPIWKFGICLDIELFLNDKGELDKTGWEFDNATQTFNSLQRKIYYLRFGHPGEKLYIKVGSLDGVSLGYGMIMSGYANSLQYPEIRKMGLHFELNDISALGIGVQAVVNNFQDFQNKGALVGTRLSVKPISFLGMPIISNLTVGASYVTDLNQRASLRDRDDDKVPDLLDKEPVDKDWAIVKPDYSDRDTMSNPALAQAVRTFIADDQAKNQNKVDQLRQYTEGTDPFSIIGADIGLPIINKKFLSLIAYGQWATTVDDSTQYDPIKVHGWGLAFPGVGMGIGPLKINVEYRHFVDMFQGEYFDQTYELDRMRQINDSTLMAKEISLLSRDSTSMNGVFAHAGLNIANIIDVGAGYQYMTITDNHSTSMGLPSSDQSINGTASVGETIRTVLRKVKVEDVAAYYYKKNIGTWVIDATTSGDPIYDSFFEPTPYVLMGYKIGFQIAASIVLYWDNQYTYVLDETTADPYDLTLTKRLNIETVIKF